MSKLNTVIFDLDGVLVNTDVFHFEAWKELADRLGVPFSAEQADRCRGVSRMQSLEIVLERSERTYTLAEKEAFAAEKNASYRSRLETMTPADVPGEVLETLAELRRRGCRLALASGSKNAGLILERTGLGHMLDAVADGTMITRSKPDPEVFLTAAKLLGAEPRECAAVDDAAAGVQSARAAGMLAVAIAGAAKSGLGDRNITSVKELLQLFE